MKKNLARYGIMALAGYSCLISPVCQLGERGHPARWLGQDSGQDARAPKNNIKQQEA